jgi:hypothetical protein
MRRALVPVVLITSALAVPAANASKAPTRTQRQQIAAFAKAPASCLKIRIASSTNRYGSVTFNGAKYSTANCARYATNGITIVRRSNGKWRQRWAGSDCTDGRPRGRVPVEVWRDLTRSYCR